MFDNDNSAAFRKSTYSNPSGNCVEVAEVSGGAAWVRDSKNNGVGPVLKFTPNQWSDFILEVKDGQFG